MIILEATNLSALDTRKVPDDIALFTIDLSYLSLAAAVPQLESLRIADDALLVGLVKPMFELHLDRLPTDDARLSLAVDRAAQGIEASGRWKSTASLRSPVQGSRGAIEFFVYARRVRPGVD